MQNNEPKIYIPLRLPPDIMADIDDIGEQIDRKRPWIVEDALRDWVKSGKWKKMLIRDAE